MFIEEDILEFQIPMYARFAMDVCHRSDELGKNPLGLFDGKRAMAEKVVVELVA
jgi:hypothetical protein